MVTTSPLSSSSPDVLGGTPVLSGTRVPVQTLIAYVKGGETIGNFLEGFPTVWRKPVIAVLAEAKARILPKASCEFPSTSASTGGVAKIVMGMKI